MTKKPAPQKKTAPAKQAELPFHLQDLDLSHITKDLRPFAVDVSTLNFDSENARTHNRENVEAIKRSLAQFGQRQPLVVQREGRIVRAGNGRLQAARELGWQYVAAVITDDTEQTAKAFALADNRTAELAEWNGPQLFELLRELENEAPALLEAVSFSGKEMDRLKARYGEAPETDADTPEDETGKKVGTKTLTLNYAKPDYDEIREAADYLKQHYGTTSNEDTFRRVLLEAVADLRQDLLR